MQPVIGISMPGLAGASLRWFVHRALRRVQIGY